MEKILWVFDLGEKNYEETLQIQLGIQELRIQDCIPDVLLLVEHPPTVTVGRNGKDGHILGGRSFLENQGFTVHEISRGGDVTYHGPGQIVGYPIIKLEGAERDLHHYLHQLEEIMIRTLEDYGIQGERKSPYTGAWVEDQKIGAIGVAVKRYVTLHGFALNVHPNMAHFSWIVPCGIRQFGTTSLKNLGLSVEMDGVKEKIITHCGNILNRFPQVKEKEYLKEYISDNI